MFIYKITNTENGKFYFGYSEKTTEYFNAFGDLDPHNQFDKVFGTNGMRQIPLISKRLVYKSGNKDSILSKLESLEVEHSNNNLFLGCFHPKKSVKSKPKKGVTTKTIQPKITESASDIST